MSDSQALLRWPGYLTWLPRFLFTPDTIPERYIGKAWLTSLLPSVALSAFVSLVVPEASYPSFRIDGPMAILLAVIIGPILETFLMIPLLLVLDRLFGPGAAVVGSALLWGVLHSLSAPAWGLIIWWLFLILSIAFLTWRRVGIGKAFLVVFAIHALQNGVGVFLMLFE